MKLSMKNKSIFLLFFCNVLFYSQRINEGLYIGFEQNPFCYSENCLKDYSSAKPERKELYYKITLEISKNKSTLTKIPIVYINKKKQIIDSLKGGYYKYDIDTSTKGIFGKLVDNKYTNFRHSCAVPKYIMVYYTYKITEKGIYLSNENNKNILLTKIN